MKEMWVCGMAIWFIQFTRVHFILCGCTRICVQCFLYSFLSCVHRWSINQSAEREPYCAVVLGSLLYSLWVGSYRYTYTCLCFCNKVFFPHLFSSFIHSFSFSFSFSCLQVWLEGPNGVVVAPQQHLTVLFRVYCIAPGVPPLCLSCSRTAQVFPVFLY